MGDSTETALAQSLQNNSTLQSERHPGDVVRIGGRADPTLDPCQLRTLRKQLFSRDATPNEDADSDWARLRTRWNFVRDRLRQSKVDVEIGLKDFTASRSFAPQRFLISFLPVLDVKRSSCH